MKKKYNFQDWLNRKVSDDPEVILAGKLEYLRLYLTDAMRELRTKTGLTQAQLAQKLGVQQAAVSKLESALKEHELESVLKYLHTLGADLLVALKQGEELYQVSDKESGVLVDVPVEVQDLASAVGMSPRKYVQAAIRHFSQQAVSVRESLTAFLESDDPVAVQVRQRLGGRSLLKIASELEKCWSLPEEDDRIFGVKNVLAGSIRSGGTNRDSSNKENEIELLDLAESLLEKSSELVINHLQKALQVFTRESFPKQWAEIQYNLALAYSRRIQGSRAVNLEQALTHYKSALEFFTREAFPEKWAEIKSCLEVAYRNSANSS